MYGKDHAISSIPGRKKSKKFGRKPCEFLKFGAARSGSVPLPFRGNHPTRRPRFLQIRRSCDSKARTGALAVENQEDRQTQRDTQGREG